jgi:hypothetical protein
MRVGENIDEEGCSISRRMIKNSVRVKTLEALSLSFPFLCTELLQTGRNECDLN